MQVCNNTLRKTLMLETKLVARDEKEGDPREVSKVLASYDVFGGRKTVSKMKLQTKLNKMSSASRENFLETLMEEMKPTFREKNVFDSRGKSLFVSTLGLLWLPDVWYQDQSEEFQNHNFLQKCGHFQPGAEGKLWWLRLQSGIIFNMNLHQMSKHFWEDWDCQSFGSRIRK